MIGGDTVNLVDERAEVTDQMVGTQEERLLVVPEEEPAIVGGQDHHPILAQARKDKIARAGDIVVQLMWVTDLSDADADLDGAGTIVGKCLDVRPVAKVLLDLCDRHLVTSVDQECLKDFIFHLQQFQEGCYLLKTTAKFQRTQCLNE